ncbi:hypothetical protein D3C81_1852800 [compost metagenome]
MCPTRKPRRVATRAWPSSCRVFATTSARAKLNRPSVENDSTTAWVKLSHCCITRITPRMVKPITVSPVSGWNSQPKAAARRCSPACGRSSGTRKNR